MRKKCIYPGVSFEDIKLQGSGMLPTKWIQFDFMDIRAMLVDQVYARPASRN